MSSLLRVPVGLWLLFLCAIPAWSWAAEVRIGFLAWFGAENAQQQWAPLVQALQRALPQHRIHAHYLDLKHIEAAIQAQQLEFVVTNPGHYVALEAQRGVTRIATQIIAPGQDSAHTVGSAVVVPAQSSFQRWADLQGTTLAAVAEEAFGGYQVVWAELKRHGLDPEDDDVRPLFTGYPMSRVIEAIKQGRADAGVIRSCLLEQLIRNGELGPDEFRVLSPQNPGAPCLSSSPTYPGWAFAAAPHTASELSRAVLMALLSLPAPASGQTWGVPADYQPVHDMLRELQIAPYAFLREHRLESQIRRYWPWAAAAALFLLLWLAYTLRVEVLVQRRTRELSAALVARHELEESVHAHQQQMEHLSRLSILGELSGTLAHELNQPLATIGNYARSLLRRQERGNLSADALQQAADEIANESERAAGILAGIRDFARKRARVRERRDLGVLLTEARALFRGMVARAPDIEIQDDLPPTRRWADIDPLQIEQVLLNLLKNALDAHRAAGLPDAVIRIRAHSLEHALQIEVCDQGGPLPEAQRARLFEPFFTTKPDGMGLGLSICKTIIEAHGGELAAQPSAQGLCFRFSLPLSESP